MFGFNSNQYNGGTLNGNTYTLYIPTSHDPCGFNGFQFNQIQFDGGTPILVTPITLSDTGSGSDSITISTTIPLADSGSGVDVVSGISVVLSLADSGSGSDQVLVVYQIAIPSDSGTGTDAVSVTIELPLSDSGSGVDIISLFTSLLLSDSGIGDDEISAFNVMFDLVDNGSGIDLVSLFQFITEFLEINLEGSVDVTESDSLSNSFNSLPFNNAGFNSAPLSGSAGVNQQVASTNDLLEISGEGEVETATSDSETNGFNAFMFGFASFNGAPYIGGGGTNTISHNTDEPLVGMVMP